MDSIIEQSRLAELLKLKPNQKAALRRALRRAGIPFKEARGVIFTTQAVLDASMVGNAKKKNTPNWNAGHARD